MARVSKRLAESQSNHHSSPPKKATPEKARQPRNEKAKGKENRNLSAAEELLNTQNFQDETETLTNSAIENYFMQGKTAAERRNTKPRRGKAVQENVPDYDDEDKKNSPLTELFSNCDLNDLRDYITNRNSAKNHVKLLDDLDTDEFSKWALYLASGFNILLHGVGSKREILTQFAESVISETTQMRVNARNEGTTPKVLLGAINSRMNLNCNGRGATTIEWARLISKRLAQTNQQVILLIDNIESQDWISHQEAICALLENRNVVKMVATVDHVYSSFIWNSRQLSSLNFIHITVNTFDMPLQELITGESRLLGLDSKSSQSSHTLASLDVFWKSLAQNSQKLFQLFFKLYFETKKPVNFWSLFTAAKDEFIVSSDTSLRTQLIEFKDHRILKWTRSDDGNDQLAGIIEQKLVFEFLASKGMGLDDENE